MSFNFSLSKTPDVLFIPKIDSIRNFANAKIGIADSIKKESIIKTIRSTPMELNIMEEFANNLNIDLKNDIDSYRKFNQLTGKSEFEIPIDDLSIPQSNDGLASFEKMAFETIFETQKPYIEALKIIVDKFVKIEDIVAKVLGLINSSKKPIFNPLALGYIENKNQINNFDKLKNGESPKNGNILKEIANGNGRSLEWEIVNITYSTGIFLPEIKYVKVYNNIYLSEFSLGKEEIIEPIIVEKPPIIVFAYYGNNGENLSIPTWLGGNKKYGSWELEEDNKNNKFSDSINELIKERLKEKIPNITPNDLNLKANAILRKITTDIDIDKMFEEANGASYNGNLYKETTSDEVKRIIKPRRKGIFLPKKIVYNNKEVLVDPEADYDLQLIKLTPQDKTIVNLNTNKAFVGNYNGIDTSVAMKDSNLYDFPSDNKSDLQHRTKYTQSVSSSVPTYVLEGILKTDSSNSDPSNELYNKKDFFSAIKDFILLSIDLIIETLPKIEEVISLIKNPGEFIFKIIESKLGVFSAFSDDAKTELSNLLSFTDKNERDSFLKETKIIKKYVGIDQDSNLTFILDGLSSISFFGFVLNIGMENIIPVFNVKRESSSDIGELRKETDNKFNSLMNDSEESDPKDALSLVFRLKRLIKLEDRKFGKDTERSKSTLDKISKVQEKFSFKTQSSPILDMITGLIKLPFDLVKGILESFIDFFKSLVDIKKIKQNVSDFLTFNWIKGLFKPSSILGLIGITLNLEKLTEFKDLKNKLNDSRKLKNILNVRKNKISSEISQLKINGDTNNRLANLNIEYIGINKQLSEVSSEIRRLNSISLDYSEVLDIPFLQKLPTINLESEEDFSRNLPAMLGGIFKLFQEIINAIICFLWDLLNLSVIIPCPKLDLAKLLVVPLSDIDEAENSNSNFDIPKYLYDIVLSNGDIIRSLSEFELNIFKKNNINFDFVEDF